MDNTNLPAVQDNSTSQNPISVLKNLNKFTKIKEFDKVGHIVIPICNKHAVLTGVDKEIDEFTKEEIAKYTALHLKNLTFEEIEIAFQNERFGLYDKKSIHYNFFSIDYFVEVITKYKIWKRDKMTLHNIPINQILLPETSNSTKEEAEKEQAKKEIRIAFINMLFDELKTTQKEYIHDAFTLYEDFVDHGLIVVSDGEKKTLYNIMVRETITDLNFDIQKTSSTTLKKEIKLIIKNIPKGKNIKVINRCKAYLVCKSIKSFINAEAIIKKIDL